ncbi:hypothetical protein LCGC14_1202030, partial [marine sediment metagenome]
MAISGEGGSQGDGSQNGGNNADAGTGEDQQVKKLIPKSGGDNKKDNVDPFANLWEDPKEGDDKSKQTPDPSQQQQQRQ